MTTPLFLRRTLLGLQPDNDIASDILRKIKIGEVVKCELKRPRSLPWHRRYWALVSLIADNTTQYTAEDIHALLKLRNGCRRLIKERNGTEHWIPDSISFDRMSKEQWSDYWERVVKYVLEDLLPGVKKEDLERELGELVGVVN